jgi:hydrogenase/urease accessory protein HupE
VEGARVTGRTRWAAAALGVALGSSPARAHLNSTGLGPVYDGAMHVLASPEDLVPVLALALFAGLRGATQARHVLFALPGAWLAGGFLGLGAPAAQGSALVSAIVFLVLGALVAADATLPRPVTTGVAILVGLYHGYVNGTGMGATVDSAVALLGLTAVVFMLVAITAAFVVWRRADWSRIAVRVAGSWIAASGLLLLGWAGRRG